MAEARVKAVCRSERGNDPKVEVEQAELRVGWGLVGDSIAHTFNFQGYSLLPTQGVFCGVLVGGSVTVGDRIRVLSRQLGSA